MAREPNQPCKTCPWLKKSTIGGFDIPGFDLEKMQNLACTVGEGDDFRTIMACHHSQEGAEFACTGYLAVEGWSNINVRLLAAQDAVDLHAIEKACADLELWPSFGEMLEAYETKRENGDWEKPEQA